MIVLGIDPGLANTGWGVIETRGSVARARAYGCIHTEADEPLHERLGQICAQVEQAISRYEPGSVAIEDIFFGQNTRSAILTAHARGAALVACSQCGVEVASYTPMQIKQAVVGRVRPTSARSPTWCATSSPLTTTQSQTTARTPSRRPCATQT